MYEQGSFVPTAKLIDNKSFSIVSDYIGRPIQAYDNNGNLVLQIDDDICGNLQNLKGNRTFIPFRQLRQYKDIETGTYISQDPIALGRWKAKNRIYRFKKTEQKRGVIRI